MLIHVEPNVFRRCIQKWTQNQAPGFPGSGRLYGVTLVLVQTGYAAAAANTIQVLSSVLQCAFTILHVAWMYASAWKLPSFNGHYYIPSWHIYIVVVYLFCMSLGRVRSKEPKKLLDFRAAWFHSFLRSSLSLSLLSTSSSSTGQRSHGNCWISGQPGFTSASLAPRHLSKASSVSL